MAETKGETKDPTENVLRRLEYVADKLEGGSHKELQVKSAKHDACVEALGKVSDILEKISDLANIDAHARGPLAREALAIIKDLK